MMGIDNKKEIPGMCNLQIAPGDSVNAQTVLGSLVEALHYPSLSDLDTIYIIFKKYI